MATPQSGRLSPASSAFRLTIRETLLDRGTQLVVTLVEMAPQIVRKVFVSFALASCHDRNEQPPPKRWLGIVPRRGEEGERRSLRHPDGLRHDDPPPPRISFTPIAPRSTVTRNRNILHDRASSQVGYPAIEPGQVVSRLPPNLRDPLAGSGAMARL
jgi:hypothetical protein